MGNSHGDLEDVPLPGMYSQVNHVHLPGCRAHVMKSHPFACRMSCLCHLHSNHSPGHGLNVEPRCVLVV